MSSSGRPTGWIVLTGALLAAVIGLAIWAAVLQSAQDDANAASAARIEELEQEVADLQQRLGAEATAAEDAQAELDLARSQLEDASAELGSKGRALEESQAELEGLVVEADAALAELPRPSRPAGMAGKRARAAQLSRTQPLAQPTCAAGL